MAKKYNGDFSFEMKEPTVNELILQFMFGVNKYLEDYSITIDSIGFRITGTFKKPSVKG